MTLWVSACMHSFQEVNYTQRKETSICGLLPLKCPMSGNAVLLAVSLLLDKKGLGKTRLQTSEAIEAVLNL